MKLIVYGSSDDLVEVEGDIQEEFNGDDGYLIFSDGTVLKVEYDGVWRFERVQEGKLSFTKHPDVLEDDGPRRMGGEFDTFSTYSEIVVLEGDVEITSIMYGERWTHDEATGNAAPTVKERRMRDEITEAVEASGDYKVSVVEGSADTLRITVVRA